MRVVFMGTPDFSVPILRALIDAGHQVPAVYCQPPRPAGRGQQERPSPVHQAALDAGIEVRHPLSLKGADEQAAFAALDAEVAVVAAYGLILPKAVLDAPKRGCINVHASLLPRWRGAAPIHRAIMAGDAETGVTIMQMEEGLDTGPMLLKDRLSITDDMTTGLLHDQLSAMGARLMVEALARIDQLRPEPQPEDGVTYAAKIKKEEAAIDWSQPAHTLARHVNGLSPFPGAWFERGGERVKVLCAVPAAGSGSPGTVLDDRLTVACGDGAVRLLKVQRAGKPPMEADAFLRGNALPKGTQL